MSLQGYAIAGATSTRDRVSNDFYATPEYATREILDRERLIGSILEPSAGQGHISKVLKEYYPNNEIISTDLIQREDIFGLNIIGGIDFLTYDYKRTFDTVITNPPFSLMQEFAEKALEITTDKVILFGKIQFLEGVSRREFFKKAPLSKVYVFSKRCSTLRNGELLDEKGKPWTTTMCHAWYVFDHLHDGQPVIDWI